jgi:hypothetical protein
MPFVKIELIVLTLLSLYFKCVVDDFQRKVVIIENLKTLTYLPTSNFLPQFLPDLEKGWATLI